MSMFDGMADLAAKMGIDPATVKGLQAKFEEKLAASGDQAQALKETMAEHGISMESLQGMMGKLKEDGAGMFDKLGLDKDGDGNPLNDITDKVKDMLGKK